MLGNKMAAVHVIVTKTIVTMKFLKMKAISGIRCVTYALFEKFCSL